MLLKNFEVCVLVHGNQVKEYDHFGGVFVEGKKGTEFTIRLKNNTHKRALAVLTIDGKSVIDGAAGSLETSGGYIVEPYSTINVPGWRVNDSSVANFTFANKEHSYAARMGEGVDNVGVIGCAFFYESVIFLTDIYTKPNPWQYPTWTSSVNNASCPGVAHDSNTLFRYDNSCLNDERNTIPCSATYSATKSCSVNNLGTDFGKQSAHSVTTAAFARCPEPEAVFTLYYDTREGLINRGVNLQPKVQVCPSPFPGSARGCPIPPGWSTPTPVEPTHPNWANKKTKKVVR